MPPEPIEICLEELNDLEQTEPYLRCVAVAGGSPGLCFSLGGEVLWQLNADALAELWVSQDNKLVLYRKMSGGQVKLSRSARELDLPLAKPVIVLSQDEITVHDQRFRVHVHGLTSHIAPPERLKLKRARNAALAATMAVSALLTACKQGLPENQGSPGTRNNASAVNNGVGGATSAGATGNVATGGQAQPPPPPIEIREHPPAPLPSPPDGKNAT